MHILHQDGHNTKHLTDIDGRSKRYQKGGK